MREDKRRAKLQRKQQMGNGKARIDSRGVVDHAYGERTTKWKNTTRELMKRDKLLAKRKNRAHSSTQVKIFVDNDSAEKAERATNNIVAQNAKDSDKSNTTANMQTQGDVLDEVVRELMAFDGMHDPDLERLMTERRKLMAHY